MKKINVGRSLENNFCIDDGSVSRRHAEIIFRGPHNVELVDLSSTHGTYVKGPNGLGKVSKHQLGPDEKILFGSAGPFTVDEIMQAVLECTQPSITLVDRKMANSVTEPLKKRCQHCRSVVVEDWSECPFCGGGI